MLKFFRRIRRKLIDGGIMSNGQTGLKRYLIYAIGEILLVMIGILLALQVNNWNQGNKEKEEEKKVLNSFYVEFSDNLSNLSEVNVALDTTIMANKLVFELFREQQLQYSASQLDSMLSTALKSPHWRPSDFVLNDLKNSGRLSKLSNPNLKKLLFNWTRLYEVLEENQDKVEISNDRLLEFIKAYGSLRNIDRFSNYIENKSSKLDRENVVLLMDYRFENVINDKLFNLRVAKHWLKMAEILIKEILEESKK